MSMRYVITALLLCTLPAVMPVGRADCPIDCPGDLNGDCRVDFQDFAIMANSWLADCGLPAALPLLKVQQAGITREQAEGLAGHFGIDPGLLGFENGALVFVDPARLHHVPTLPLNDPALADALRRDSEVEPGGELQFETLDLPALRAITPVPAAVALDEVLIGLSRSGIELGQGEPQTSHSLFEIVDTAGQLLLPAVQLDTRVSIQTYSGAVPIIGPGAQFSATLDPQGNATHLHVAARQVDPVEEVLLVTPEAAAARASTALGGRFLPEGDVKLVYYAPPMSEQNVEVLVPHYDIGGILYGSEGQQADKLRKLIPATEDPRYVPQVDLSALALGSLVQAQAAVNGGRPPYRFEWFSSSADLSTIPDDVSQIEYNATPRQQAGDEVVAVKVTDDNGIIVEAAATVQVSSTSPQTGDSEAALLAGGVRDFGVERAVSDLCAANQAGFINRFLADGVVKRFNWTGASAWERDFKQPPAGTDTTWVDNADIVFYCGHGYGGGFTFESNMDDGYLTYTDAAGAWGNYDLEWLSLLSCQVLMDTYDGKKWNTRWGPAFDGLHLLTGFQTNAYDWPDFGPRYAAYMLGRKIGIVTLPPMPVRSAWFLAKNEEQPSSVQAVVMGVVGPGNILGGYNDYFWGKGPVSADLRGNNIRGFWRLVYQ